MAFGGTDRVETTAWRAQGQRAEPARRAAESRPSRFDAMLAKPEATPRKAQDTKAQDTKAQDRAAARRDDRTAETRDTPKPRASTDEAPRAAKTDEAKTVRDKPQAKPDDKGDKGDKATDGEPIPDSGKAAKAAASADVPAKDEAAATATPTPTPVPMQIQANPTQPARAAGAQAAETAAGETAAVASASAKVPAVPAADTAGTGEASAPTDGKAAEAKDVLALLGDPGQGAAKADAAAAPPTAASPQGITQASSSAPAAATQPAQATVPTPPAVPIGQVPMTIGLRSLAGSSEFQIRLDPVELGRIDVKLEIDKAKGTVATHMVVDRPDTLALLQRDAGQLQQALTQAGLDPSAGGVNLSLRGEGGGQAGGQSGSQGGGDGRPDNPWSAERSDRPTEAVPVRMLRGYGGLDIRI